MQETFRAIITEMGGTAMSPMPTEEQDYGLEPGGRIIHEVRRRRAWATTRTTSVLNEWLPGARGRRTCSSADGGPFVSQADKNLTWTILALAMRTSEYIAEERKKGSI